MSTIWRKDKSHLPGSIFVCHYGDHIGKKVTKHQEQPSNLCAHSYEIASSRMGRVVAIAGISDGRHWPVYCIDVVLFWGRSILLLPEQKLDTYQLGHNYFFEKFFGSSQPRFKHV